MLDLGIDADRGMARCYGCGWSGVPIYRRGKPKSECPKCEGFGDEFDLCERPLAHDVYLGRRAPQRVAKQGRNEPCNCGSGLKAKRCCGA